MRLFQVYREVKLTNDTTDTVIVFYNRIFVHEIKAYIANFVNPQLAAGTIEYSLPV